MSTNCSVVATGIVTLNNTTVGACFNSPSSRYPNAGPFSIVSGQHDGLITLTNIDSGGSGGIVSFYSSPSNTRVDISISGTQTTASAELIAPLTDTLWQFCYEGPRFNSFNYEIDSGAARGEPACIPGGAYCKYGTEPTPAGTFIYYLTPALLDVWLAAEGMPWLAPLLTAFWFTTINAQTLCGQGPPNMPVINLSSFDASIDTLQEILSSIAWPNICRCKTGVPTPTPYPAPSAIQPASWPSLPTFSCSNNDLCTTVLAIQKQVAFISKSVGPILELLQLEERYRLPFAVIDGAVHSGMTGIGSFGIGRLIGMRVDVTNFPTATKQIVGNPPYLWNLGWMSIGNQDGFVAEKRITRALQSWFPTEMPQGVTFKFFLQPGVTATFTEIQAEP